MCLVVNTKVDPSYEDRKPHVAQRDLIVFKTLKVFGPAVRTPHRGMAVEPYMHYYQEDTLEDKKFTIDEEKGIVDVLLPYEFSVFALHSNETLKIAITYSCPYEFVVKAIIPAGSEYYTAYGEVCSDNLIITDEVEYVNPAYDDGTISKITRRAAEAIGFDFSKIK